MVPLRRMNVRDKKNSTVLKFLMNYNLSDEVAMYRHGLYSECFMYPSVTAAEAAVGVSVHGLCRERGTRCQFFC